MDGPATLPLISEAGAKMKCDFATTKKQKNAIESHLHFKG